MLQFSNCKINIGLNVTGKRNDGYHNIESVFYPIDWTETIEIMPSKRKEKFTLFEYGITNVCPVEQHLCFKAYQMLDKHFGLPSIELHLLKTIPTGAGLGGGSSNGANTLKALNTFFNLKIEKKQLEDFALQLGSDCPFFISTTPSYVEGRGEMITPIQLDLSDYSILLIHPKVHLSTAEAYRNLNPHKKEDDLRQSIQLPIEKWRETIVNDFEKYAFEVHPLLARIKNDFYAHHALYASMSGSGSTVFGIFNSYENAVAMQEKYSELTSHLSLSKNHMLNFL